MTANQDTNRYAVVVAAPGRAEWLGERMLDLLAGYGTTRNAIRALVEVEGFFALEADLSLSPANARALRNSLQDGFGDSCDFALVAQQARAKSLLICDMDSTVIGQECLDELADYAGLKAEIAAITERAMRGELDFEEALESRVARLAGLELEALERCYRERIRLNRGARTLVASMKAKGARTLLVSGGFTFFTERVGAAAGFEDHRANRLLDDGRALTGAVAHPILGREAKLATLLEESAPRGGPESALAIGDGANDLAMIEAAGLGLAYRAKPVLAAHSDGAINHTDLRAALAFQGYGTGDIVDPDG